MVNERLELLYDIYDETSIADAAAIIRDIPPELGIILILGNQICPADIPDFVDYRSRIQSSANAQASLSEIEQRYFNYLELQRLITSNFLPHHNLLCLLRLVRKKIVKSIITTNYDQYISSAFQRYGHPYKCVLNPCLSKTQYEDKDWDCDRYYSPSDLSNKEIPLWTIHGNLDFVRMDECLHIFSLPAFRIDRITRSESNQPSCCHCIVLKDDGDQYSDPSLAREHVATWYHHHIDFGANRQIFKRESEAAKNQILRHCERGGALFIAGLSFNPRFPEDLTSILARTRKEVPLVYIVASRKRIQVSDNALLSDLQEMGRDFILVNEINEDKLIDNAIAEILTRSGEQDIDGEFESWKTGGKWWVKI